jgi:hydrogenase expression/formation protein HypC
MCLAVPSLVISTDNLTATVDVYGARKEISLLLLAEETKIGDYVLVHAGFAIQKVDEAAAQESLALLRELAAAMEDPAEDLPD